MYYCVKPKDDNEQPPFLIDSDLVERMKEYISDRYDVDEDFSNHLNNEYDDIEMCGNRYSPTEVLHAVNDYDYDSAKEEWVDGELAEFIDDCRAVSGDYRDVLGKEIRLCTSEWDERFVVCDEEGNTEEKKEEKKEEEKKIVLDREQLMSFNGTAVLVADDSKIELTPELVKLLAKLYMSTIRICS